MAFLITGIAFIVFFTGVTLLTLVVMAIGVFIMTRIIGE